MFVDLNGLWVQVVVGVAIGGLVNGGFELIEQKKKGGDIDWKAVGKTTCVGVVEGAVCSVAGPELGKGASKVLNKIETKLTKNVKVSMAKDVTEKIVCSVVA